MLLEPLDESPWLLLRKLLLSEALGMEMPVEVVAREARSGGVSQALVGRPNAREDATRRERGLQ